MTRPKRAEWIRWLEAQGHDLAGLTGTDVRALAAVAACWELAVVVGVDRVWPMVRTGLLPFVQGKYHTLAIELVARSLDWSDRDRLRKIAAAGERAMQGRTTAVMATDDDNYVPSGGSPMDGDWR